MFDYIPKQNKKIVRNEPYRPKIFKNVNDVAFLTTDYKFENGSADLYETSNLVQSGVDMKSTDFTSDIPLQSVNEIDNIVAKSLKSKKNEN